MFEKYFALIKKPKIILKLPAVFYIILILIICINIFLYSYKAWLYPIRDSHYFDECSYIAMGKYFRTFSPVKLIKDYLINKKPIPELYNEFDSRMIYFPLLMSIPLKFTENRAELHIYRAIFLAVGTIIFFLLGHKLGGITGGFITSTLWFGIPLLNYWGHFFMSENPSFIFIALGYLLLLSSDRWGLSAIFGGMFLGLASFTRFTTITLVFPAPFLILAVYFNPFRRKQFQLLGELSKTFFGFCMTTIPYLVFIALIFKNPLTPFQNAMSAVNQFPINDKDYYLRNLWIEGGPWMKWGVMLSFLAPLVYGAIWVFYKIYKSKKEDLLNYKIKENENNDLNINNNQNYILKIKSVFNNNGIKYSSIFIRGILYYGIIIISLIITVSIYLYGLSSIPHKLPRYLMGAIIPFIIMAGIGFGLIERFFIALLKVLGIFWIKKINKEEKNELFFSTDKYLFSVCMIFILMLCLIPSYNIIKSSWTSITERTYTKEYVLMESAIVSVKNELSVFRLQPEYLLWGKSLSQRLEDIKRTPPKKVDISSNIDYTTVNIINYLNKACKDGEVFYVDRQSMIPLIPAYVEVPCIIIKPTYSASIKYLIDKGQMPYDGYVLIYDNNENEYFKDEDGKSYYRSLNRYAVNSDSRFTFAKDFKGYDLYYFKINKKFPFKYGTIDRIKRLYTGNSNENSTDKEQKTSLYKKLFYSVIELINN